MRRKTTTKNQQTITFTPAEKGVLKRIRTLAYRHLAENSVYRAFRKGAPVIGPVEAEVDEEFAKRLLVWLNKRMNKNNE